MLLDTAAIPLALQRIEQVRVARRQSCPRDLYIPGRQDWPAERRFQLQFHQSRHIFRLLALGNGAGKTTVAGVEADYWLQANHPYQPTPQRAAKVIWVCLKYQQMDVLRGELEANCLSPGWTWNDNKKKYTWPNGSMLFVISNDGDWASIQGVQADLIICDEECDPRLWRELKMRRRGKTRRARYIVSATATKGKRWMYKELFVPWLKYHEAQGLTEEQAMVKQLHPTRFVWARGGIEDNPGRAAGDESYYDEELAYASEAERTVRRRGGFADFNASPVFDHAGVKVIETTMQTERRIVRVGSFVQKPIKERRWESDVFAFLEGTPFEGGEIRLWEEPVPGEDYSIGADFGAGLQNSDFDAAVVIRQKTRRQVGTAVGRWGDVGFAWVLYSLGWYFNEALIVGERQFGLPVLRRLYDEWGYTRLYHDKDEEHQAPRMSDLLGHHSFHGDCIIPRLQWAIAPKEKETGTRLPPQVWFRDPELIDQLYRYQWQPKSKTVELVDSRNRDLVRSAPPGYHDDLVMAAAFAVHGWLELPKFKKVKAIFPRGSLGELLQHADVWHTKKDKPSGVFKHSSQSK